MLKNSYMWFAVCVAIIAWGLISFVVPRSTKPIYLPDILMVSDNPVVIQGWLNKMQDPVWVDQTRIVQLIQSNPDSVARILTFDGHSITVTWVVVDNQGMTAYAETYERPNFGGRVLEYATVQGGAVYYTEQWSLGKMIAELIIFGTVGLLAGYGLNFFAERLFKSISPRGR